MSEIWIPSENDYNCASKHYVEYATGLTMLSESSHMAEILGYKDLESDLNDFVINAEDLMLKGLRGVISYANHPEFRSKLIKMENNYDQANPIQLAILEYAFYKYDNQLDEINPKLKTIKPLPINDRVIYGYLCHSRLAKINTKRLIQPFRNSEILDETLESRTLVRLKTND